MVLSIRLYGLQNLITSVNDRSKVISTAGRWGRVIQNLILDDKWGMEEVQKFPKYPDVTDKRSLFKINKYAIHAYTHGPVTGSGLSHTSVV